jgi:hypothetical protein
MPGFRRGKLSKMSLSLPKSSLEEKPEFSFLSSRRAVPVSLTAPRFITFGLKDTGKTLRKFSPLYEQKAFGNIAGKISNFSVLKK